MIHLYFDAVKINLIYDSSFWINKNLQDLMPSHTDLEINEFYIENAWTNGSLTVIHFYSRGKSTRFWYSAQLIGDKYAINNTLKIDGLESLTIASTFVIEQCIKKFEELTNIEDIPLPLAGFINFWAKDSENQGTSRFKNGVNVDKLIEQSLKPNPNENIFISVSDFSLFGGWMESSLNSAKNNIQKNFNITNPLSAQQKCAFPQQ